MARVSTEKLAQKTLDQMQKNIDKMLDDNARWSGRINNRDHELISQLMYDCSFLIEQISI